MCAPLLSSGPLNRIIVDLNKPYIIGNGGEMSDLEYLPTKTEYIEYLQIADMKNIFLPTTQGPGMKNIFCKSEDL